MTHDEIEKVGSALTELFKQLEGVIIENCALKKVLTEAARPNDPKAPPLPEQVQARIPEEHKQVGPKLSALRERILQALRDGRLPELAELAGSTTKEVN